MPLVIPDEALAAMRMDEQRARVEIACRLFDAGTLTFGHAACLAKLSEAQMDDEIARREIPRYRISLEDFAGDVASLRRASGALGVEK